MVRKGAYKVILSLMIIVLVTGLALQLMSKTIATNFLDRNIPDHIRLEYSALKINILSGSIGLEGVHVKWSNRDTTGVYGILRMDTLSLTGLGYLDLLFHNSISLDHIELVRPKMDYLPFHYFPIQDTVKNRTVGLKRELAIGRVNIVDGEFIQLKKGRDSIKLQVEKLNLVIKDLKTDEGLIKNKIPFTYGDYILHAGNMRMDMGPFEILEFNSVDISGGNLLLDQLSISSKYTKRELSKLLKQERDHIDLRIPEIGLSGLDFGQDGDRFFINAESVTLNGPNLEIYRDKLVADDLRRKKLYGQMLREVPLDMDIAGLTIKKGYISYSELVAEGTIPGEIYFTDIDARLKAISNVRREGTTIEINAKLMGDAPLLLNWNLDSRKEDQAFLISGNVSHFKAKSINPFLRSNLKVEAEGEVKELYFTINGDAISAKGDMKMRYSDFSFKVLRKDRMGVNKILTAIGNIFVNDGSKTDDKGYRYGDITAERDATKSFFNYLWLNVKSGILSTLTGDGKE